MGDTCYTYDEDNMTYNPDGKAIIAMDNSVSSRRKEDISKAYFNCHTDIDVYKRQGKGLSQRKDGLYQGRFVNRFGKKQTVYAKTLNEVRQKLRNRCV